jgi:putative ABC transport system permease protein
MKKNEILTALFISKKNIMRNKMTLSLTVIIIALGFISSIMIYGILRNTGYDLQENFIETITGHIVIEPYDGQNSLYNSDFTLKKLKSLSNIVGVSKINKRTITIFDKLGNSKGIELYIVNPYDFSETSDIDDLIEIGTFLNEGEKGKIVLGCLNIESCNDIKAYRALDIEVGETSKVLIENNTFSNLTLQGIYNHQFFQVEFIGLINEETAEDIFSDYNKSEANSIIIRLPDRSYTKGTIKEIENLNLNAKVYDWEEKTSQQNSIVESFLIIGDLSFIIGIIISAISVYIILYINILNKKSQIGIIKALGIKSKVVSTSYVILSLFLGILGSIAGILLTFIAVEIFKSNPIETGVGNLAISVSPINFIVVTLSITLASVFSGYLVSKRITKQNIITSIYHG